MAPEVASTKSSPSVAITSKRSPIISELDQHVLSAMRPIDLMQDNLPCRMVFGPKR